MSTSDSISPLLNATNRLGIQPKYASGNWARFFESWKNFFVAAGQSEKLSTPKRIGARCAAVASAGLMMAFYGEQGPKWLGVHNIPKEHHGEHSGLGWLLTLGARVKPENASLFVPSVLTVLGSTFSALSVFEPIARLREGLPKLLSQMGSVMYALGAGFEVHPDILYKSVKGAVTGAAVGAAAPDLATA